MPPPPDQATPGSSDPAAGHSHRAAARRAAAVAGHRGDESGARSLLGDADPKVRATSLGALARMGTIGPNDLAAAVIDPSPVVRRRAAEIVASLGDDHSHRARDVSLLGLLDDPDPAVVEVAAWASGERVPPEAGAVSLLAALTAGHDDPLVREAAVAALGAIGDPAGLPAILAATQDRATVRRRAVIALAPFEGPAVDEALQRALADRDWQVRQAAEDLGHG